MRDSAVRERGSSEVAFSLLRVLTRGYCMWGAESHVSLAELSCILGATSGDLTRAIAMLWELDLVLLDDRRHTIRLSKQGILQLATARETLS